jgi:hypothetical protein
MLRLNVPTPIEAFMQMPKKTHIETAKTLGKNE